VKTVAVALPALPDSSTATGDAIGRERLRRAGLMVSALGDDVMINSVAFSSAARRAGWEQGWDVRHVLVPNPNRPSEFWTFVPALLIWLGIWMLQGRRLRATHEPAKPSADDSAVTNFP